MTITTQTVKLIPLGGLGAIGRNCLALECDDTILVIDAGLMFPEEEMLGVDLVIPDFTYLVAHQDQVRGIVLTHGHEDHIGALTYLLDQVPAPVYATPLTRGLVEAKLKHSAAKNKVELHTILPGQEIVVGPFRVTPFHVNHSIPDSVGLAIRTPLGLIVHTGDFKIDHTPIEGRTADLASLARLSNEGVVLLLSDSTNAESPGYTASERELVGTFHQVFTRAKGRIIVATFASLLSRVQLVIETAAALGRKVAVAGRSMEDNIAIAEQLGYVHFPDGVRVPLSAIQDLPDDRVCVLATGSQGEPNAALARMATGRFRYVNIREGDTVVLSSKAIPGNETAIYRNIDSLTRLGADVVYGHDAGLHVSGHAAQEELKLMLNLLRPLYFVPVHGAHRMLRAHAKLAFELGMSRDDVFILDNGECLNLTPSGLQRGETLALEDVLVDGALIGDVGSTILRDRQSLGSDGFVVARVTVDLEQHALIGEPEIISQGFVYVPESAPLLAAARDTIQEIVSHNGLGTDPEEELGREIKRRLSDLFFRETRRRPVVIAMVSANVPSPN
ncbi:MAG: ribonuclease J [Anaerolineales bacterium]